MTLPIQKTYTVLKQSFTSTFQPPSPPSIDKVFNDLYDLHYPLTKKEIKAFISRFKKINSTTTNPDSLENKLYQFIASSHFSSLYGIFCRENSIFSLSNTAFHKTVGHLVKTQCSHFNNALIKANINEPSVSDITEIYIQYLIAVENSTLSTTDSLAAKVIGFDLDETKREAKRLRLELQQRLSNYQSTRKTSETISINPTFPSSAPLLQKKEKGISKFKENLENKSNAELNQVVPENNTLPKEKDVISPVSMDKPEIALQETNTFILKPLPEEPKETATETSSKNASGFIDYLMRLLRAMVQLVSTLINKLRCHADTPSATEPKTPVTAPPQQKIKITNVVTSPAPQSPMPTSIHWQKPKPKTARTESPNAPIVFNR